MFHKQIPFELAEPGTDPTLQHNSHPGPPGFFRANLWLVIIVVFVASGYFVFHKPHNTFGQAKAPPPAPTSTTIPDPDGGSGFFASNVGANVSGFLPKAEPLSTPVYPPTPTSAPTPPPTPTPLGLAYGVFVDGEQVLCWCTPTLDGIVGGTACLEAAPSMCGVGDGQ